MITGAPTWEHKTGMEIYRKMGLRPLPVSNRGIKQELRKVSRTWTGYKGTCFIEYHLRFRLSVCLLGYRIPKRLAKTHSSYLRRKDTHEARSGVRTRDMIWTADTQAFSRFLHDVYVGTALQEDSVIKAGFITRIRFGSHSWLYSWLGTPQPSLLSVQIRS